MPAKTYWFYLEPFVYVSVKKHDLLLVNALTGKFLSYCNSPRSIESLLELERKENLYALDDFLTCPLSFSYPGG